MECAVAVRRRAVRAAVAAVVATLLAALALATVPRAVAAELPPETVRSDLAFADSRLAATASRLVGDRLPGAHGDERCLGHRRGR